MLGSPAHYSLPSGESLMNRANLKSANCYDSNPKGLSDLAT